MGMEASKVAALMIRVHAILHPAHLPWPPEETETRLVSCQLGVDGGPVGCLLAGRERPCDCRCEPDRAQLGLPDAPLNVSCGWGSCQPGPAVDCLLSRPNLAFDEELSLIQGQKTRIILAWILVIASGGTFTLLWVVLYCLYQRHDQPILRLGSQGEPVHAHTHKDSKHKGRRQAPNPIKRFFARILPLSVEMPTPSNSSSPTSVYTVTKRKWAAAKAKRHAKRGARRQGFFASPDPPTDSTPKTTDFVEVVIHPAPKAKTTTPASPGTPTSTYSTSVTKSTQAFLKPSKSDSSEDVMDKSTATEVSGGDQGGENSQPRTDRTKDRSKKHSLRSPSSAGRGQSGRSAKEEAKPSAAPPKPAGPTAAAAVGAGPKAEAPKTERSASRGPVPPPSDRSSGSTRSRPDAAAAPRSAATRAPDISVAPSERSAAPRSAVTRGPEVSFAQSALTAAPHSVLPQPPASPSTNQTSDQDLTNTTPTQRPN